MTWFALIWLLVVAGLLILARVSSHFSLSILATGYLWSTLLASGLCFVMYFLDKRAAQRKRWRISEKTLHTFEALGGWPGALLGQQWFRHKTQKFGFKAILWMIIAIHIIAVGCVVGGLI